MLWWMLQNLLIAGLLAGVVWIVCRVARVGPVGRHALWLLVLVKLLTPPMVVWPWAIHMPLERIQSSPASTTEDERPVGRASDSMAGIGSDLPVEDQQVVIISPGDTMGPAESAGIGSTPDAQ